MRRDFRDHFKFYKRKDVPLDLSDVIDFNDFNDGECSHRKDVKLIECSKSGLGSEKLFGLKNPCEWMMYEVLGKPGLFFIKNPFNFNGQRYWIIRCLEYYTKKPSKLNIDVHNIINGSEDWWKYCHSICDEKMRNVVLEKLRWATFGYHHNWDTKEYSEASKSPFPCDLKILCNYIARMFNFSDFNAEAAIINLYHFQSSLSGHTDHSEINMNAPLFSFSFGQSAIFLIGGKTTDEGALPILIESGDIIIMSGESRHCYHGVPRILPAKWQAWNSVEKQTSDVSDDNYFLKEIIDKLLNDKIWECFDHYVKKSRINMNVRQVLLPGQQSLND